MKVRSFYHVGTTVADFDWATEFLIGLGLEVEDLLGIVDRRRLHAVDHLCQASCRPRPSGLRWDIAVYLRFQSPQPGKRGVHTGVFGLTNMLGRAGELSSDEHRDWRAGNEWFNAAYPNPSDADPWVYDEELHPRATAWFKPGTTHLLERVPRYLEILEAHNVACVRVDAADPGRVIYEDDVQIVVVPHDPEARTSFHPQRAPGRKARRWAG